MRPVYSNTFNVTHNKNETTLNFAHGYTAHTFSMQNGALTDVSAQVVDEVASILVNREGVISLARLLNRVVRDWGIDLDRE